MIALAVVLALAFGWTRNSFGLLGPGVGSPEVSSVTGTLSLDGRFLTIDAVIHNRDAGPVLAQIQPSLNPLGVSQPWNDRLLEGPTEEVTLASGARQSRRSTVELDLPAGRYDAWVWMRIYSDGAWVGVSQRRVNRSPLVVAAGSPVLRAKSPAAVDLEGLSVTRSSPYDPAAITVSATVDNRTRYGLPVAVRWGLDPVDPGEVTAWFRQGLVPSGGVRWISAPPGLTNVKVSGVALVPAGTYRVRVQIVPAAAPAVPSDAASASALASAPLDEVLVTTPVLHLPASAIGLVRVAPPAGPLAVTALAPPATIVQGVPAKVTLTVSNLADRPTSGTVFVILAAPGNRQPWAAASATTYPVAVSVPTESSQDVTVTVLTHAPAGTYELSAWIHGSVASTLGVHVDGAYSAQPVMVVNGTGPARGSSVPSPPTSGDAVRRS